MPQTVTYKPIAKVRLYVEDDLAPDTILTLTNKHHHYVRHVMRVEKQDRVALFNGAQGEWLAHIETLGTKETTLRVIARLRPQTASPDITLLFSPLKKTPLDILVEKAVELGVRRLQPVICQRTQAKRLGVDRLKAGIIAAAEQCERLDLPTLEASIKLPALLEAWPQTRLLIVGIELGPTPTLASLLQALDPAQKISFLVGPEGGFSEAEQAYFARLPFVRTVGLGPRILRAETAAISLLACWQALCGDWEQRPVAR